MAAQREGNGVLKMVLELGPLVTFFVVNARAERWDLHRFAFFAGFAEQELAIMAATSAFMIATVVSLCLSLVLFGRIPTMPLVSGVIVLAFGGLTLYLQNETFIKLKPTIVNLIFSATLLGGLFILKRPLLGVIFNGIIDLDREGWVKLSFRWGLFFLFLAILNEIVWRNFSTDFWVSFKVFGIMPITVVFALTQVPLMQRHALEQQ